MRLVGFMPFRVQWKKLLFELTVSRHGDWCIVHVGDV